MAATLAPELAARVRAELLSAARVRAAPLSAARCPELGAYASGVARPNRRLRGTRLRWRLLTRLRRCGRSSSRRGQASGRALVRRSALAATRPRRLGSRLLLLRRTSLRRAATRGRGFSTSLLRRRWLSTCGRRRHRLGRCGLLARRLSG